MDVLEIMTAIRNIENLDDIPDRELLRSINNGYRFVVGELGDKVRAYLVQDAYTKGVSGTGLMYYPDDVYEPVYAMRNGIKCSPISIDEKELIGVNVNYPSDNDNPLCLFLSARLEVFPAMPVTTPAEDIKMVYLAYPPDLLFGQSSITSGGHIVLNYANARHSDDYYKNSRLSFYNIAEAKIDHRGIDIITAYIGSSTTATMNTLSSLSDIYFASIPVIPEEYHTMIIDAAVSELAKIYPNKFDTKTLALANGALSSMLKKEEQEIGNEN